MSVCEGLREMMPAQIGGELDPLKIARLEAHLGNCDSCRRVHAQLEGGLAAARNWQPAVDELEVERLVDSMGPYLVAEPRRIMRPVAITAMAACLAAVGAWQITKRAVTPDKQSATPAVQLASASQAERAEARSPTRAVVRRVVAPQLKVVQSANYRGSQSKDAKRLEVEQGFAVFQLEGERAVVVVTPDLEIKGMGARFFVEVEPNQATTLGILAGRATLMIDGREEVLEAGARRRIGKRGAKAAAIGPSAPYHDDVFLAPATGEMAAAKTEAAPAAEPPKPKAAKTKRAPKKRRAPAFSADKSLIKAEELARTGQLEAAVTLYSKVIRKTDGVLSNVARLERARLWLRAGSVRQACTEMKSLARSSGEVAVQAKLSVCECSDDPCEQQACLKRLVQDPRTRTEAMSMMARTPPSDLCDEHKKDVE